MLGNGMGRLDTYIKYMNRRWIKRTDRFLCIVWRGRPDEYINIINSRTFEVFV